MNQAIKDKMTGDYTVGIDVSRHMPLVLRYTVVVKLTIFSLQSFSNCLNFFVISSCAFPIAARILPLAENKTIDSSLLCNVVK